MNDSSLHDAQPPPRSLLARIFISLDERRLRAGWRLAGQLALLFVFFACIGIPLGIIFALTPTSSEEMLSLFGEAVSLFAITLSVYLARRFLDRRSFVSLGLKWDSQAIWDLTFGIGLSGLLMGLIYLVEWGAGWLSFETFAWESLSTADVVFGVVSMAIVFVIVGWTEELISRGYWLQNLSTGLNLFWGVLISSILFALAHMGNPNVSWVAILGLVTAGIFLAYGYLRTSQLWLPIGLHIGWNFFEGTVFGFPVSGTDSFRLILQSVEGPEIITGGAFGPEAGLIILPALLLGTGLIYFYTLRRPKPNTQHEIRNT